MNKLHHRHSLTRTHTVHVSICPAFVASLLSICLVFVSFQRGKSMETKTRQMDVSMFLVFVSFQFRKRGKWKETKTRQSKSKETKARQMDVFICLAFVPFHLPRCFPFASFLFASFSFLSICLDFRLLPFSKIQIASMRALIFLIAQSH